MRDPRLSGLFIVPGHVTLISSTHMKRHFSIAKLISWYELPLHHAILTVCLTVSRSLAPVIVRIGDEISSFMHDLDDNVPPTMSHRWTRTANPLSLLVPESG